MHDNRGISTLLIVHRVSLKLTPCDQYPDTTGHIWWHQIYAAELRHAPTYYTLRNRVQE
ncbi:MAG: hypothetical protein IJB64_00525 [Akkermansia sp.]|nr:hypothetical protein [Akkermansia sp.]